MDRSSIFHAVFAVFVVVFSFSLFPMVKGKKFVYVLPDEETVLRSVDSFANNSFETIMALRENSTNATTSKNIIISVMIPFDSLCTVDPDNEECNCILTATEDTETDFGVSVVMSSEGILNLACNFAHDEKPFPLTIDYSKQSDKQQINSFSKYEVSVICQRWMMPKMHVEDIHWHSKAILWGYLFVVFFFSMLSSVSFAAYRLWVDRERRQRVVEVDELNKLNEPQQEERQSLHVQNGLIAIPKMPEPGES